MANNTQQNVDLVPIREVARITGINPITLRAWERRYGLVEPIRTISGHRMYSQSHIDLLKQVVALTEQGVPLRNMKDHLAQPKDLIDDQQDVTTQVISAVKKFDVDGLNRVIDRLLSDYPQDKWLYRLRLLTQAISEDSDPTGARQFWTTQLLPRLYSRLHLACRQLSPPYRFVHVQSEGNTDPLYLLISAIWLVAKGYYPLVAITAIKDESQLLDIIQKTHCQAIAVVSDGGAFEHDWWQAWVKNHPSFELFLVLDQEEPSITKEMLVSYYYLFGSLR